MKRGFTLIELMLYVSVCGMLLAAVGALLVWTLRSQAKSQAEHEVTFQALRVAEVITKEIQNAKSVYTPSSVFATHPSQLSLETSNALPQGEQNTYVDFFVCDSRICMKREGQNPLALTSEKLIVQNFVVRQVGKGAHIDLTLQMNPAKLSEYQAIIPITFSSSPRFYGDE